VLVTRNMQIQCGQRHSSLMSKWDSIDSFHTINNKGYSFISYSLAFAFLFRSSRYLAWSKNAPYFIQAKVLLPCAQQPSMVSIMSHMTQVQNLQSYFFKVYCNIILPSTTGSSKRFFPSGLPLPPPTHTHIYIYIYDIFVNCN
jgi:hypothetical protein